MTTAHDALPAEVSPYIFDSQPAIVRFIFGSVPEGWTELRTITWESFFAPLDLLQSSAGACYGLSRSFRDYAAQLLMSAT